MSSELLEQASAPFTVRKENFGCLVYDRGTHEYIAFDKDTLQIFTNLSLMSLDETFQSLKGRMSRVSFDTFLRLCSSINLIKDNKLNGVILNNKFPEKSSQFCAPTKVFLQLTRYCNLACTHCWSDSGKARPRELNSIEVRDLLKQMASMGCFVLNLGGGEPLGRRDFAEVIEQANQLGICVNISTNATMATKSIASRLGKLKINSFRVSLAGGNEKTYDSIRVTPSYRRAVRGISNLRSFCPDADLYFHTLLQRHNHLDLPSIIRQAEKLEVKRIVFSLAMPVGRASGEGRQQILSPEEAHRAVVLLQNLRSNTNVKIDIEGLVPPDSHQRRPFNSFGCECGQMYCHISSEGVVAPSGFISDLMPCGNIRKNSLYDIWNSSQVFKSFRSNSGDKRCRACPHYEYCRGGCRTRAILFENDSQCPDPYCSVVSAHNASN